MQQLDHAAISVHAAWELLSSAAARALPHCVDVDVGDALSEGARARERMFEALLSGDMAATRAAVCKVLVATCRIHNAADKYGLVQ